MADQELKNVSFYTTGKKHGNASKISIDFMSGGESVIADDGHLGVTKGKRHVKITVDQYVPVGGKPEQDYLYQAWKKGTRIKCDIGVLGGHLMKYERMSVLSMKADSDTAKGTCTMNFDIEGPPAISD